ncbi:hypothetical protein GUJ93_ZPchr0002g24945 [Zizania palustris]|uniref:Uncharacterized protein n=1 Tax=Zizania palustris TaxID=103762 RepID=A0A8J5S7T5_ZIZPA|nr:hypothetical protein GUJ93_ZPchr0002g24945 [Zizania palustris]
MFDSNRAGRYREGSMLAFEGGGLCEPPPYRREAHLPPPHSLRPQDQHRRLPAVRLDGATCSSSSPARRRRTKPPPQLLTDVAFDACWTGRIPSAERRVFA